MRKIMIYTAFALAALLAFAGCAPNSSSGSAPTETAASVQPISAEDAKALIGTEGVTLIDVRTKAEYDKEHIEGAILLPQNELEQSIGELNIAKSSTIIVYCLTGGRSSSAAKTLVSMGYTKVYDLGGISSWPYETVTS